MGVRVLARVDECLDYGHPCPERRRAFKWLRGRKAALEQVLLHRTDRAQELNGSAWPVNLHDHTTPVPQPESVHAADARVEELGLLHGRTQLSAAELVQRSRHSRWGRIREHVANEVRNEAPLLEPEGDETG
jgi:hypothetical protein